MKEIVTVFDSKSKTYKTPISPTGDKTHTFETLVCSYNMEMYAIMCTNFILNIPIVISKPMLSYRRITALKDFYPENVTYIILDIDEVGSEFNKQMIIYYFKNYKVILGESRSYDGYSNFNLKGVLFTEETPINDIKDILAELTIELSKYGKVDESVARRATLNAPVTPLKALPI